MKRFLIIQTAYLGDVILATSLIETLKLRYPDAEIDIVVNPLASSLLENHQSIDRVIVFDKSRGKLKAFKKTSREVKTKQYDEVINLHRFFSSGLLSFLAKGNKKIGFKKNPFSMLYHKKVDHEIGDGTHEVERNLKLIEHHGITEALRPTLYPSLAHYEKVESFKNKKYFCLAPASVWKTKQLPNEKWINLLKELAKKGNCFMLGAPNDADLANQLIHEAKIDAVNLCGQLNLLESAALMHDATMNFVNDSAPLHIASAMNAPVKAFFCSTVSSFGFGPLSENAEIIETKEQLACRPCGIHGYKACPKGHFKCGHTIEMGEALKF